MALSFNQPVRNVFVLMLENRSFDHLFARSGIAGIAAATAADTNPYAGGAPIPFSGGAPATLSTDPHHEFGDVLEQLCGKGATLPASKVYPPITNQGFAENYATTFKNPPATRAGVAKIMAGVDTAVQTPAIYALARNYVLCDHWFSSLPGATWPNRFFVHGASSAGLEHSPTAFDIGVWEALAGFKYPNGSVFDRLGGGNWRLYQDKSGPIAGQVPQVSALKGIRGSFVHDLAGLEADLAGNYPYAYTFIEPAYGDVVGNTYRRGSSQHPRDGLAGGDRLVARVYNALRQSPLWRQSMLIITYDEHGGFYDHVAPGVAPAPGDNPPPRHNKSGFDFTRYGVRVPAIVVSPWVGKGVVDPVVRDHASVAATLTSLFGMAPLTERDRHAASLWPALRQSQRPDSDCPASVTGATDPPPAAAPAPKVQALFSPAAPVPDGSNLQAVLYLVRKAHAEASVQTDHPVALGFAPPPPQPAIATVAEAQAYIDQLAPHLFATKNH